ncbi:MULTISPECIES: GNAT family N-acetyltransferase [Staphylococcus]|uniref:N-acetyltransferase domain-containing protein n=2 Tax=Staphylococcus haemolyticus TaxID=1283 RepID=Q4L556_STAHJ|nr:MULTISPECIES: GNAT family N-acetyltransferase [Staphylococcus]KDP49352.1 acetyltransferase (GNAT) domain protein [Staphylococcus aureus subsp. aureus CO-98]MDU2098096.1 GNAT family N-acetyltransferase [Staphylococcus sp.]AKC76631.1 GNAT family acetyltransferase [Staphylococcus haemolyticus]AYX83351.1 GNAT family N-acetyltransferase [Staphylococcus haemolyticus]MBC3103902.1 GNAT family N-acetyltransferase [Staphylococcus haemolyticus]
MFEIVKNKDMLSECFYIRREVFVKEQGVPLENELDSFEEESIHIIGYDKNHVPFACARFRPYNNAAKVERVAILKPYRKDGYGKTMMHAIERFAKDKGYNQLVLNAQVQAQGFYEKLGYIQTGPVFIEENIDHIKMYKNI